MLGVERIRIVGAAQLLDSSWDLVVANPGTSRTVACPGGGSFDYAVSGSTKTMTYHGCDFGGAPEVVVRSGSIASTNAAILDYTGTLGPKLSSGDFTITNLVYATTDTGSPAYGVDEQADSTFFHYERRGIGVLDASVNGLLTVTRAGRADSYTLQANTQIGTVAGLSAPDITLAQVSVRSPRFLASAEEITLLESGGVSTVIANDRTQVVATRTSTGWRYQVRASTGGANLLDTTLANSDPAVVAAVRKALD
jgi:hypothetical protein